MSRVQITLEEAIEAKKKGLNFVLDNIQVQGVAVIKDKDGNVKGEMELTSIQEDKDASIDNGA